MLKKDIRYKEFSPLYRICTFITHVVGLLFSQETKLNWYDRVSMKQGNRKAGYVSLTNDAFGLLEKIWLDEKVQSHYAPNEFKSVISNKNPLFEGIKEG